ncbi:hypothetical protein ElyMa_001717000 [Elysia marginata]|uniref:Uncharacterized protein n=1 Tax=Elysia marginata TaxID=1093978 RepID=A0AAV4JY12_9GAST|nr:hypothetical protein ElyMa_001717000 [Elysia marginata]
MENDGEHNPIGQQLVVDEATPPVAPTPSDVEVDMFKVDAEPAYQPAPGTSTELPPDSQQKQPTKSSMGSDVNSEGKRKGPRSKSLASSQYSERGGRRSTVETIRPAEIMYRRRSSVIQNPLLPPGPCHIRSRHRRLVACSQMAILPGPDSSVLLQEKDRYRQFRTLCSHPASETFNPNPAAITPLTARPNPHTRAAASRHAKGSCPMGWKEREERLKDYRDHLLAEEIGYETLVGNLLYIDIPNGRDINRSWENFLRDDVMEWGFPYYKGSRERPRVKQREPYLAHQLKEKLWKYPKTRIFYSVAED